MSGEIIDLQSWCETPAGSYLLAWEREQYERAVADIFGYHALQLGLPALDSLSANRMPHRWLAHCGTGSLTADATPRPITLHTDYAALPFSEGSLDLVTLPHTLDLHPDPHAVLREVARVLAPNGKVLISGFNPMSLWGWRQRRETWWARTTREAGWHWLAQRCQPVLPADLEFISPWRLRDWLRLLNLEVEAGGGDRYGLWRPLLRSASWLHRWRWLDSAGGRWWPVLGAVYFVVAVKRVQGVRLLEPRWRRAASAAQQAAPASLVRHRRESVVSESVMASPEAPDERVTTPSRSR
ncbi:methyltransferase domain-containing protein [Hylemonella gracilis]|uniref:methyltransferase domain-containing protein n=1 Tax=Hylemonella gracilis TaxID=80880 RepID=UPI0002D6B0DD|nr:methyltransferase domain-containing protein [Hylemonella gracilis]